MVQKTKRSILWIPQTKKLQTKKNLLEDRDRYTGIHLVAEFWYGKNIENPKELKKILLEAAKKANNTPLEVFIHKFSPQGITGVVLLAESHITIHTWPEFNYTAIDIFTCGKKARPYWAIKYLKKIFKPKKIKIKEIKRGLLTAIFNPIYRGKVK
jgi:S-adenosylmethionine decarboxylase proenzyme